MGRSNAHPLIRMRKYPTSLTVGFDLTTNVFCGAWRQWGRRSRSGGQTHSGDRCGPQARPPHRHPADQGRGQSSDQVQDYFEERYRERVIRQISNAPPSSDCPSVRQRRRPEKLIACVGESRMDAEVPQARGHQFRPRGPAGTRLGRANRRPQQAHTRAKGGGAAAHPSNFASASSSSFTCVCISRRLELAALASAVSCFSTRLA